MKCTTARVRKQRRYLCLDSLAISWSVCCQYLYSSTSGLTFISFHLLSNFNFMLSLLFSCLAISETNTFILLIQVFYQLISLFFFFGSLLLNLLSSFSFCFLSLCLHLFLSIHVHSTVIIHNN